ncbi:solute carrier organic anion transporter family member 4A1-like isoform X2 [Ostrea edulis]|uniref:solute carrier organic anion transporter family member 4A1-like isoform X2 n=1 Tax=Ostrea edulis TaxID=37623 RepID=UPI0024AEB651|nr:solute carrier organic anion transporter family member 4A1-like isoform X2 [Ostrea edulis]XP_055998206.1 solute carrier organic anion transporter family member 4A1-like isoform X2 [Ostrea edulis]XP_055998207.1 solute carrier organic anion transporter family member 4A1-like isoform X2 [Ostrea edulis]XP_055998208.1 solute carrier organic anion transporter family member 4A1-like isoform X2 [Ostrea edulis]XP_055998209.1 solute carrier organic anion transporter family member 4A1-like isoform X2 [
MTKEKSHTNGSTEYSAMRDASSVNKPDEKVYRTSFDEMDHTTKEAEEGEGDTCGWLGCRPATLERFQRPTWVLVCLCWAGAIQGMVVNGFVNVVISNIERRYDLTSTETGTIASCYDIASVLCLIPVSYFGGLGCKPRYLGIGVLIMGLGSIVFALPQFTSGVYSFTGDDVTYCDVGANVTACTHKDSLSNYKYVFFLGQLLHGAGAAPLYTLGVTYLDENLPVRSSSFYIGIYYAFAIVGPAIGYLAGGAFLNIYVDVDKLDTASLTPSSPRWVGAWWIGFLLSGVLAFLVAFPMCGFPTKLPGSENYKKEREKEVYHRKGDTTPESSSDEHLCNIQHILQSVKTLVTNPTFMFLNLAAACEGNLLAGFATFAPKFIEAQFSLQASDAAQYVGYAAIPAGGGGTFLGGYLVKRFNLGVRGIIRFCLALSIPCFLCVLIFLVNCENVLFAGVNIDYGQLASNGTRKFQGKFTTSSCNVNCGCTLEDYNPVCGIDGIMYYSPCYAGCTNSVPNTDPVQYGNCSCIGYDTNTYPAYMAVTGKCESSCSMLPLFMAIFFFIMLLTFTISMPALSATLRCVPQHESSFALGIQWIIARCLGSIPGPILFGKMIDLTCLLWQIKCDDNEGSCFFYNNKNMSYNLMGIALAGKFLSILFFSLSLAVYKAPPKEVEKENQSKDLDAIENKMNGGIGIGNNASTNTSTTSINNGTTQADVNKNNTKTNATQSTNL